MKYGPSVGWTPSHRDERRTHKPDESLPLVYERTKRTPLKTGTDHPTAERRPTEKVEAFLTITLGL